MGVEGIHAVAQIDHDVIAIDVFNGDRLGIGQLSGYLVIEGIERVDDCTSGYGENVGAVGGVIVDIRRIAVDQTAIGIELHPVDGEALRDVDAAVAGEACGTMHAGYLAAAVAGYPAFS